MRYLGAVLGIIGMIVPVAGQEAPGQSTNCAVTAENGLSGHDVGRMERLLDSRTRGLAEALRAPDGGHRALLASLFETGLQSISDVPVGRYQCRTLKLGGLGALTVYGWFECEVSKSPDGMMLNKITGSQNFTGQLLSANNSLLFKGAGYYGYENPRAYGDNAERDLAGCFSAVSGSSGHFVLEFPEPRFESRHDVIEFKFSAG